MRLICAALLLAMVIPPLAAQTSSGIARHIQWGAATPPTCNPSTGDIFFLVSAGPVGTPKYCSGTNTWTSFGSGGGGSTPAFSTVSFSATPTFTVSANSEPMIFKITLTNNVTSSTLDVTSATAGQQVGFVVVQDGTGGRTFVWPTNVLGACSPSTTLSRTTVVIGVFDGTNVVNPSCISDDPWHGSTSTPVAFSNFPACASALDGSWGTVSDAASTVLGTTVTGSGSGHIIAYCNGTNWVVAGGALSAPPAPSPFAALTDGATVSWDATSKMVDSKSLTFTTHGGSRTLNVSNLANGGSYVLWLKQDGTGGEGLTLGTGCTWKVIDGGAGAVTLSTGANAIDVLAFTYDGTNCYANLGKNYN